MIEEMALSIKIDRTLHPNRESALPLSQGAISWALNVTSPSHDAIAVKRFFIISDYLFPVKSFVNNHNAHDGNSDQ
jgi:hypothetical protein